MAWKEENERDVKSFSFFPGPFFFRFFFFTTNTSLHSNINTVQYNFYRFTKNNKYSTLFQENIRIFISAIFINQSLEKNKNVKKK